MPKPAPIVISAKELYDETLANIEEAKAKYSGKFVRSYGQIHSQSQGGSQLTVYFGGIDINDWISGATPKGNVSQVLIAHFKEPEVAYFYYISVGQSYLFEGFVEFVNYTNPTTKERLTFITFKDCEFITRPKKPKKLTQGRAIIPPRLGAQDGKQGHEVVNGRQLLAVDDMIAGVPCGVAGK